MIDKQEFSAGMAVLAGAFGREIDAPIIRAYYAVLSPELTTEEFAHAVTVTLRSETFWPSPAVLLGKVEPIAREAGLEAFHHVNRVMARHHGYMFMTCETFRTEFDAPTRAAIFAVDGLAAIAGTEQERWGALERHFVSAYSKAVRGRQLPALSPAEIDPHAKQLTAGIVAALPNAHSRPRR